jgi:signal transduction histidine kinase
MALVGTIGDCDSMTARMSGTFGHISGLPDSDFGPDSETLADRTSHLKPFLDLADVPDEAASVADLPEDVPVLAYTFLPLIAHDLRSPLASILGYAACLTDPTIQLPEAERNRYCSIIANQAQAMAGMLDGLLTAAQIDAGQLGLEVVPVPLGALVAALVDEIRQRSQREIILEDSLNGPGSVLRVMGDALGLRQAFHNLVENAIKYSPSQTPVHIMLRESEMPGWAECIVADEGIGITDAEMALLFRRFGRIQNKHTQGIPGWGLGLYITKYMIERMGGQIQVESQPNLGARFIVRLPLVRVNDV